MTGPWLKIALVAAGILTSVDEALAQGLRGVSPSYRGSNRCPERCVVSGPNTGNWSIYSNFNDIKLCQESMFFSFSLYDQVHDEAVNHRISACTSFGPDFLAMPPSTAKIALAADPVDIKFELGWWKEGFGLSKSGVFSLTQQLREYIDGGHGVADRPFTMFAQSGQTTIGIYIGEGLLNQGISEAALGRFEHHLRSRNVSTPSLAMQLCGPGYTSTHTFGIMASSNGTFTAIQDAAKSWNEGKCLSFSESAHLPGQAKLTKPLLQAHPNVTASTSPSASTPGISNSTTKRTHRLHARGDCTIVQVDELNNSCAALASKCEISPADFTKYNPEPNFCANLRPKQHVCCSSGTLPDLSPKPNSDGSCHSYTVKEGDNCETIAAENTLTKQQLEDFNNKTWGWNGCELLFGQTIMCLSTGSPPFPAPIANAQCGPQKPGSKPPTDGSDISELNPCHLNACCNIWGQCGITRDFCIDTNTGAPGTAKPGTYGCISNCGIDIVKGDGTGAIRIGYFQGYGLGRPCLHQDASQIDTSAYTHLHFAFGVLTPEFEPNVGDVLSRYQFEQFKELKGVKRILSFGGWDFSALPATYSIFRNGVMPTNRLKMAVNIANFVKEHDLDGVDIDWEYPGAPDFPDIPPADPKEGYSYLAFLVILKSLLPGKSVSIAAPSSYWYLKQYPIKQIGQVVDYIVYMTYDLHGQWDAQSRYSQVGCPTGNCLRSQVNLTETRESLAMITKAGVPSRKVIVGVTSYGRSFKMAQSGCFGPDCLFTGDRVTSQAKKGVCTGTGGYISDAEIDEIMNSRARSGRVISSYLDTSSNSDILVYDDLEWVSYMSPSTKASRTNLYKKWGMGGTTDWATDLQEYNPPPPPSENWATFKREIKNGNDPKVDQTRDGNWTDLDCTHKAIDKPDDYTPSERWQMVDADAAWEDAMRIWRDSGHPGKRFMKTLSDIFKVAPIKDCQTLQVDESCGDYTACTTGMDEEKSGPAGMFIWNSLMEVFNMHKSYRRNLFDAASTISFGVDDFQNKFAPIPNMSDKKAWDFFLINLLTVGILSVAGPFFNSGLSSLAYFARNPNTLANAKDTTMTLISQSATIGKDFYPDNKGPWKVEGQDEFSTYMGSVISGWANVTELAVKDLFDGDEESIEILWSVISDGKLIDGKVKGEVSEDTGPKDLKANIEKSFYAYTIPILWRVSGTYAFIVDTGLACGTQNAAGGYVEPQVQKATGACVDGIQYYLVYPKGESYVPSEAEPPIRNSFSEPTGMSFLGGKFGGITKEDLVKGSVKTWTQNGRKNGGPTADLANKATIDSLFDGEVTTPGLIRLPVCSPDRAWKVWNTRSGDKSSTPDYPCEATSRSTCGDSTFENESSGGSPKVDDCLQIIKNIEGDWDTSFTVQVVGQNQRQLLNYGSCQFGVQATETTGNVNFEVGGQDVIDIINEAVKQFGGNGKVGAKGNMKCNGNIKQQGVKWGIY